MQEVVGSVLIDSMVENKIYFAGWCSTLEFKPAEK